MNFVLEPGPWEPWQWRPRWRRRRRRPRRSTRKLPPTGPPTSRTSIRIPNISGWHTRCRPRGIAAPGAGRLRYLLARDRRSLRPVRGARAPHLGGDPGRVGIRSASGVAEGCARADAADAGDRGDSRRPRQLRSSREYPRGRPPSARDDGPLPPRSADGHRGVQRRRAAGGDVPGIPPYPETREYVARVLRLYGAPLAWELQGSGIQQVVGRDGTVTYTNVAPRRFTTTALQGR